MSNIEKKNYLNAVNCLALQPTLPAIHSKFPGTINRYDDFVAVHNKQTPSIHWVVSSLAFCFMTQQPLLTTHKFRVSL